jgi:predicted 3-demethylubiquinone-9 3-methyltransferase (glyoxalase superfamily)
MTKGLRTFLTFQAGEATGALDLYREVFDDFDLIEIDHYGAGDIGPEGTVKVARFRLARSDFSCADSPVRHEWGFTPAVSLWIDCDDNNELQRLFDRLSDGGKVFMPLDDYGFSTRFGDTSDRYHGTIVKNTGDGRFACFDGPSDGLAFATDFRRGLRDVDLRIGCGLHTGGVEMLDNGDITGTAVNVAARVEQAAEDGSIFVSSTVRDMVHGSDLRFMERGEHHLKGFDDPWHLFALND